jgi:hypothetical protein
LEVTWLEKRSGLDVGWHDWDGGGRRLKVNPIKWCCRFFCLIFLLVLLSDMLLLPVFSNLAVGEFWSSPWTISMDGGGQLASGSVGGGPRVPTPAKMKICQMFVLIDLAGVSCFGRLHRQNPLDASCLEIAV